MFKKILIANRGEIALRIIRTCREIGIKTVAVYSEADIKSMHVEIADEAICIGPSPIALSYLNDYSIFSAAIKSNADAIHPGYGFFSENVNFALQCKAHDIFFIGPSVKNIKCMGDKVEARLMAQENNVPVVPGSEYSVNDENLAIESAKKIGFPVIIKATAGGGGKGMRMAYDSDLLRQEFLSAKFESKNSFGSSGVYIEKLIYKPRHIELQILADNYGNVIHLGDRDCSAQKKYQKIIEEAPSLLLHGNPSLRSRMIMAAIDIAKACNFRSAGTVEFLVDKERNFYFIEMNARIQVEHPVTEIITNIDLIKWQVLIAANHVLSVQQKDVLFNGHAIECRINAENPKLNFTPSPGLINFYYAPGGHGVRIDSHCHSGYIVPPYYDSMIGKVIAWGANRESAINRMNCTLSEYLIYGIDTTICFAKVVMQNKVFKNGEMTTDYINILLKNLIQKWKS